MPPAAGAAAKIELNAEVVGVDPGKPPTLRVPIAETRAGKPILRRGEGHT